MAFSHVINAAKPSCERFFIAAAVALFTVFAAGEALAQERFRVVVFGDSLTSGYQLQREESFPTQLADKLKEVGYDNVDVINMSKPGDTAADAIERMNPLIVQPPDIVVVALGTNDALSGIRPETIYRNLGVILSKLYEKNVYIILAGPKAPTERGYSYSRQLADAVRTLANHFRIPLYPDILDGVDGSADLTLGDGFHPNAKGVEVMVEGMYRLVDTGLRWKMETLRIQQEYRRQLRSTQPEFQPGGRPGEIEPPVIVDPTSMPPAPSPAK